MDHDTLNDILAYLKIINEERLKALILSMAEIGGESGCFTFDEAVGVFTDEQGVPLLKTYETFLKLYD